MRKSHGFGLIWLVANAACLAADAPAVRIPHLQGTTFAGERVELPQAFSGRTGILVIGFTRGSQSSAKVWGSWLFQRYETDHHVAFYELPVVAEVPALLRNWVLDRIRGDVSAPARTHFLPVLDNAAQWKVAAGATQNGTACVLVVDATGFVRWRYQGTASPAAIAELQRQVELVERS